MKTRNDLIRAALGGGHTIATAEQYAADALALAARQDYPGLFTLYLRDFTGHFHYYPFDTLEDAIAATGMLFNGNALFHPFCIARDGEVLMCFDEIREARKRAGDREAHHINAL